MSLGDHNHGSQAEFENVRALSGLDRNLDGVVDLQVGVGVSKGSSVVCDGAGDLVGTNVDLVDSAELVLSLLAVESDQDVSSLDVVQETEAIVRLGHLDDIHESGGKLGVGADLSVDLDATFHADLLAFLSGQRILEAFAKNNGKGQALTELVGSLGGSGGPDTSHLADVPVLGSMEALQMLLGSTSHFSFFLGVLNEDVPANRRWEVGGLSLR
mmetsp:Transcript_5813/g.16580  ORF Transcript_5813/g.16580 Transcript_5813/m.16580 type:complete len:214 (-) Transcript_5813:25-666(-)